MGGASSVPPLVSEVLSGESCQRLQDDVQHNIICHIFSNNYTYSRHIIAEASSRKILQVAKWKKCANNTVK